MSYCRFSSDNFRSDVYVYESYGGSFITHVAGKRVVGDIPEITEGWWKRGAEGVDQYLIEHDAQMKFLNTAQREDIDLPHAGESFQDGDLESLLDRLLWLRKLGYNVPEGAITMIREEIEDAE